MNKVKWEIKINILKCKAMITDNLFNCVLWETLHEQGLLYSISIKTKWCLQYLLFMTTRNFNSRNFQIPNTLPGLWWVRISEILRSFPQQWLIWTSMIFSDEKTNNFCIIFIIIKWIVCFKWMTTLYDDINKESE